MPTRLEVFKAVRHIWKVSGILGKIIAVPAILVGFYFAMKQGTDIFKKYFDPSALYAEKFYFSGYTNLIFPGDTGVAAASNFLFNKEETEESGIAEVIVCAAAKEVANGKFAFRKQANQFSLSVRNSEDSSFRMIANIIIDDATFFVSQEISREEPLGPFKLLGEQEKGDGKTSCI